MASLLSRTLAKRRLLIPSAIAHDSCYCFTGEGKATIISRVAVASATPRQQVEHQRCCLSTSRASSAKQKNEPSTSSSSSNREPGSSSSTPTSLRHLVRPFLLKCHPDAVQNYPDAKRVNLVAIQHLNAFVDTMEEVMEGSSRAHKVTNPIDWPESVNIEFVLPIPDTMLARKKPKPPTLSRRRVELAFPPWELRQRVLASSLTTTTTTNASKPRPLIRFQWMVQKELAKLVRTAGLTVPRDFIPAIHSIDDLDQNAFTNFLLNDDMDEDDEEEGGAGGNSGPHGAFGRRRFDAASYERQQQQRQQQQQQRVIRPPPSKREMNRDAFMARVNWKKQEEFYKESLRSMEEDIATVGMVGDVPTRKQKFIDQVLSRVRVQSKPSSSLIAMNQKKNPSENDDEGEEENEDVEDNKDDSKFEPIPIVDQLVALRRISILLYDNFNDLELEDMGQVWENMVMILTPPRLYNTSQSALNRRRKKRQYLPGDITDGFMFSYDKDNRMTVHVPVDFTKEEFLDEFHSNLYDFSEMLENQRRAEIFPADTFLWDE